MAMKVYASQEFVQNVISDEIAKLGYGSLIEPTYGDTPRAFITGSIPTTKDKVLAELLYISRTETFHAYLLIKCQGTSSLSYPKKNFTIEMYSDPDRTIKLKKNFMGWGEQYKFCLKANWIDFSHARNIVSARLWSQMVASRSDYESLPEELRTSPNNGAIDGFPIRVWCNGVYWGRYTWNIPKAAWMCNMDKNLDTHCILCSEDYVSSCFRGPAVIDESDWTDELHDTVPDSIVTSLNNAIDFVMNSTDDEFVQNLHNYFNVPSLIDYYIFSYAICHLDGLGKNQLLFTYDGIHWIASAYDMDSTFGLYWDGTYFVSPSYLMQEDYEVGFHGTSNLLYERLATLLIDRIRDRWDVVKTTVLSASNIAKSFDDFISIVPQYLHAWDYDSTTGNGNFSSIPNTTEYNSSTGVGNNMGQIFSYAVSRLKFVESKINYILGEAVLRENFSPARQPWIDEVDMNFSNGDYVEASIDLSGCTEVNECILSVGDSIASWSQGVGGFHMYYTAESKNLRCHSMDYVGEQVDVTLTSDVVLIRVDSSGVYVDGNSILSTDSALKLTTTQIGSAEGSTRSNALYNYIKVFVN